MFASTDFKLFIEPTDKYEAVKEALDQTTISTYLQDLYFNEKQGHWYLSGVKWSDHEKDLMAFSKLFPRILFILQCVGAEYPDSWRLFIRDGKRYKIRPTIAWPSFDAAQLK